MQDVWRSVRGAVNAGCAGIRMFAHEQPLDVAYYLPKRPDRQRRKRSLRQRTGRDAVPR